MTLNDICSGKARLEKCSAETVYKLAKELNVPIEELLAPYLEPRPAFDLYRSSVCHRLKELGAVGFLTETIKNGHIETYYKIKWYPESLYLLAMVDYVSRMNGIPLCTSFDPIRKMRLKNTVFPSSIVAAAAVSKDGRIKERAIAESIPEFIRFNIVESEVGNII